MDEHYFLNESAAQVRYGERASFRFPEKYDLKEVDVLLLLLFLVFKGTSQNSSHCPAGHL